MSIKTLHKGAALTWMAFALSACGDTATGGGTGLELRLYSAVREGSAFVPVLDDPALGVGVLEHVCEELLHGAEHDRLAPRRAASTFAARLA